MSAPDVDDVLNYLSLKFNKIFCERDFVCCVIEDFQTILTKKSKCCVLVFPTLGPIYLKALRYQARIFDLAVFNLSSASGKFKSLAVCHKDHLLKIRAREPHEVMADASARRKRPERQLYVPPAQRTSRLSKSCDTKVKRDSVQQTDICNNTMVSASDSRVACTLSGLVACFYPVSTFECDFSDSSSYRYQHSSNCLFHKLLEVRFDFRNVVKIYESCTRPFAYRWKISQFHPKQCESSNFVSCPVFDLNEDANNSETQVSFFQPVLVPGVDFEGLAGSDDGVFSIVCDHIGDSSVLDFSSAGLGHFCIVPGGQSDYVYECQEIHNLAFCYANKAAELKARLSEPPKPTMVEPPKNAPAKVTPQTQNDLDQNKKNTRSHKNHEEEKEIMRKTKENINRKSKPIMKYVDDSDDLLKIGKHDSVNNWEDLFDDNGEIQDDLLTDIVEKVGDSITIITATEDYSAYSIKPPEELEHIVELYNFPSTLETHDLVQAFSHINSDAMYVKWVDDTHALLILGSLSQAQKAVSMQNALIKVRPMTTASAAAMGVAAKTDLRPAMKRPATNLQTARRLITSHLGQKSRLTKEQIAKEKEDLKNARDMKRLIKQSERDAWEGNIRSTVN